MLLNKKIRVLDIGHKNTRLSIGSTEDAKLKSGFFVGFLGST